MASATGNCEALRAPLAESGAARLPCGVHGAPDTSEDLRPRPRGDGIGCPAPGVRGRGLPSRIVADAGGHQEFAARKGVQCTGLTGMACTLGPGSDPRVGTLLSSTPYGGASLSEEKARPRERLRSYAGGPALWDQPWREDSRDLAGRAPWPRWRSVTAAPEPGSRGVTWMPDDDHVRAPSEGTGWSGTNGASTAHALYADWHAASGSWGARLDCLCGT